MKLRSTRPSRRASLMGWLRLVRLPNLLTVPGDALAGYLLVAGAGAAWSPALGVVIGLSLLLYVGGLIMNDLADVHMDVQERPDRPLPSGAVDDLLARLAMITCLALALLLARYLGWPTVVVTLALLVSLTLYNQFLKGTVLGPLLMGCCRGLNVWLGASLVPERPDLFYLAAGGYTLYVVAVTAVASGEVTGRRIGARALWPLLAVALLSATLFHQSGVTGTTLNRLGTVLFLAFAMAGLAAWRLWEAGPRSAPPLIGLLISVLLFLQAALCLAADAGNLALFIALLLLLAWPLQRLLARLAPSS